MMDRNRILEIAKKRLEKGRAEIKRSFVSGDSNSRDTAQHQAILMDETLQFIWHEIGGDLGIDLADHLALLAVGGYGRGQLAPFSDIDLLFLRVGDETALQDQTVESMLYVLWDLGLKVGQAVRTPSECLKLGSKDFTILTSLIEMRLIRGSRPGFIALKHAVNTRLLAPHRRAFVVAKMAERKARHERQGQSRYTLEPQVKEGKGGLRDLHALSWIARAVFGDGQVSTLISSGVFSLAQAQAYEEAEAFLLKVRLHLHYLSDRAEERLSFDAQLEIAKALGYGGEDVRAGVEMFMQDYFRAAKSVGALTGIMIATMEEEFQQGTRRRGLRRAWLKDREANVDGFPISGGRLSISGAQQLAEQPLDFLRYFVVAHEKGLSHAPSTLRLISQNLSLIDDKFRHNPQANRLFLDLLTHANNPKLALRTMNETGVLATFLPEWASIVGLMQFNRYHSYTVDEHTLYAIDQLHQLRASDLGDMTKPVHELFEQVDDQDVLFVSALYHDIAKGRAGKHELVGAELAPQVCARLGLDDAQGEQVAWLIKHHLDLSDSAFQRDIDDPETLAAVANFSQSANSLRLLYILTTADVRAVGPDTWSAWKGALLNKAFLGAGEILRSGEISQGTEKIALARKQEVSNLLDGRLAKGVLGTHLDAPPLAYWLAYTAQECASHAQLAQQAPHLDIQVLTNRKALAVTFVADDAPGLFARLVGAMALADWSVEAAKAHTFRNGLALDTLYIRRDGEQHPPSASMLKTLRANLNTALEGQVSLRNLSDRLPRKRSKRQKAMDLPATVKIETPALANSPTIIEVRGPDRPALLFDLTATLSQLGMSLKSLRVATYGERYVNVFYVTDLMGYRLEGQDRLDRAKSALLKAAESGATF